MLFNHFIDFTITLEQVAASLTFESQDEFRTRETKK